MQIIKLGLISAVVFALLITGISLFFPSHVRVSKALDISADKATIMAQLKDTANWKSWYPGIDSLQSRPVVAAVTDTTVIAGNTGDAKRGTMGWNIYEGDAGNYYHPRTVLIPVFGLKNYLWPIKDNDLIIDNNLVQNPYW